MSHRAKNQHKATQENQYTPPRLAKVGSHRLTQPTPVYFNHILREPFALQSAVTPAQLTVAGPESTNRRRGGGGGVNARRGGGVNAPARQLHRSIPAYRCRCPVTVHEPELSRGLLTFAAPLPLL